MIAVIFTLVFTQTLPYTHVAHARLGLHSYACLVGVTFITLCVTSGSIAPGHDQEVVWATFYAFLFGWPTFIVAWFLAGRGRCEVAGGGPGLLRQLKPRCSGLPPHLSYHIPGGVPRAGFCDKD